MIFPLKSMLQGNDVLFGVALGRQCFEAMVRLADPSEPEVLYIDFAGIHSATVSFLREGPLAYRKYVRDRGSNIYPVVANASAAVCDSMHDFLKSKNDALFCCDMDEQQAPSNVRVVGSLEEKQQLAFDLVAKFGAVTATTLAQEDPLGERVGTTAWNNRLAALLAKSLIIETRRGRAKMFTVTLSEQT